ncbi:hypothetical protein [Hydrogenophaga sp.]|uniref:A1S_2505 family phage non-structural protein n=1 Tax=Hydrogenophaga sp. TaxID=1904254 RepID=UPI0025C0877B|nr:hypothetical protein [Hydrogenophaga sp.]MBT9467104.1 hypothetical protein [Hydrogenophaga sp.]
MNTHRKFHTDGAQPSPGQIFVFGSNLSGIHAGGAARAAHLNYGAEWGVGEGRTGECYALPTVQAGLIGPLALDAVQLTVGMFLHHAATHPEDTFLVTRVGCGIAGHADEEIAPLFRDAPLNCSLPDTWREFVDPQPQTV